MTDLDCRYVNRRHDLAAAIEEWCVGTRSPMAQAARSLAAHLRHAKPWDSALFPTALSVARQLPQELGMNLGSMLTTLGELPSAADGEPWEFEPSIDPWAFRALAYSDASSGIARTKRDNRDGWWTHARRHRSFVLSALPLLKQHRLAVVFGAGKAYDLPLPQLAQHFDRLLLIDIDARALAETTAAIFKDGPLRRRIELRSMDLTGVGARLARTIREAVASATSAESAQERLSTLCASYRLARAPRFLAAGERADLVVSGMVLTQLALQPKLMAASVYRERFGELSTAAAARWSAAWNELDLKIQQDHINALLDGADLAVLTSDVAHHSIAVRAGVESVRESWLTTGSDALAERLPGYMRALKRARWVWPRIAPRPPTHEGVRSDVDGLIVGRASPPSGSGSR